MMGEIVAVGGEELMSDWSCLWSVCSLFLAAAVPVDGFSIGFLSEHRLCSKRQAVIIPIVDSTSTHLNSSSCERGIDFPSCVIGLIPLVLTITTIPASKPGHITYYSTLYLKLATKYSVTWKHLVRNTSSFGGFHGVHP